LTVLKYSCAPAVEPAAERLRAAAIIKTLVTRVSAGFTFFIIICPRIMEESLTILTCGGGRHRAASPV
jgi:hypothetical protein